MTPKQLYKHIETIYNHFDDFKSKMLIDNFLIIKRDSYYQGFISVTDNLKLQFKIEFEDGKNYRTDDKPSSNSILNCSLGLSSIDIKP